MIYLSRCAQLKLPGACPLYDDPGGGFPLRSLSEAERFNCFFKNMITPRRVTHSTVATKTESFKYLAGFTTSKEVILEALPSVRTNKPDRESAKATGTDDLTARTPIEPREKRAAHVRQRAIPCDYMQQGSRDSPKH